MAPPLVHRVRTTPRVPQGTLGTLGYHGHPGTEGRCTSPPARCSGATWGSAPQEPASWDARGRHGRPRWRAGASIHGRGTRPWMPLGWGVWIALGSNDLQQALWACCSGSWDPGS